MALLVKIATNAVKFHGMLTDCVSRKAFTRFACKECHTPKEIISR